MNSRTENRTTFILSLLLHLLFLLFFFFEAFKNRREFTIIPIQDTTEEQMLAALLPKKSDGGTQVIFDDSVILPIDQVLDQPTTHVEEMEEKQKTTQKKEEVANDINEIIKEVIEEEKIIEEEKPQEKHPELTVEDVPAEKFVEAKPQEKPKEKDPADERKVEIPKDFAKLALANLIRAEKTTVKEKKEESLATCYVDHEKGNSCLIRNGANRFPSLEEMKYICYEKQIEDHIISTWKSQYGGTNVEAAGKVSLTFLITQNGAVEELSLLESSGSRRFDTTVLNCIRNTTFPPIPKHFGVKKYRPRGGYTLLPSY